MAHLLHAIHRKIERGFDHLHEFEAKGRAFLGDYPYEIVHRPDPEFEVEPDGGWFGGFFHVLKEPPVDLGIIGGEAIGQFRSALDHVMTAAVRLDHPNVDAPNFPIFPIELWKPPSGKPGQRGKFISLVRPEHLALLDGLQVDVRGGPPFRGGPAQNMLSIIQWFTNLDKHEVVHPVYAAPSRIRFRGHPNVNAYIATIGPPYELKEGTELYRVHVLDKSKVDVPLDFAAELVLGLAGRTRFDGRVMRHFGQRVRAIVDSFAATTPEWG